jgi:hypothetical protein
MHIHESDPAKEECLEPCPISRHTRLVGPTREGGANKHGSAVAHLTPSCGGLLRSPFFPAPFFAADQPARPKWSLHLLREACRRLDPEEHYEVDWVTLEGAAEPFQEFPLSVEHG